MYFSEMQCDINVCYIFNLSLILAQLYVYSNKYIFRCKIILTYLKLYISREGFEKLKYRNNSSEEYRNLATNRTKISNQVRRRSKAWRRRIFMKSVSCESSGSGCKLVASFHLPGYVSSKQILPARLRCISLPRRSLVCKGGKTGGNRVREAKNKIEYRNEKQRGNG